MEPALIGRSALMTHLRETIAQVAAADSTVFLVGETGAGKELVARLVHQQSARRGATFVAIHCGTTSPDLLERDLFGYETTNGNGTPVERRGLIEDANGGTILLDEVADLPLAVQPRVLHFLQHRAIRRVGTTARREVDVRVIASTQRNLEQAARAGAFRADLFFALGGLRIDVPPLRSHPEDLAELCDHLVDRACRRLGRPPVRVDHDAIELLALYAFPGNVRELENLLERALVLRTDPHAPIVAGDFPDHVRRHDAMPIPVFPLENGIVRLQAWTEQIERDLIARALREWPRLSNTQIAERLGTNRRVFELRMRQYGLQKLRGGHASTANVDRSQRLGSQVSMTLPRTAGRA
jgi:DNA-binding NtrC family response regulator